MHYFTGSDIGREWIGWEEDGCGQGLVQGSTQEFLNGDQNVKISCIFMQKHFKYMQVHTFITIVLVRNCDFQNAYVVVVTLATVGRTMFVGWEMVIRNHWSRYA